MSIVPGVAARLSPADFAFVADLVRRRSAIELPGGKEYLVESRLAPVALDLGLRSVPGLIAALRRSPDRATESRVVDAMTTNETFWFRDAHPFTALRHTVLPDVLVRNARTRSLRVWSAACSTGQELYSIAMLLDTDLPELASWSVDLFGTDISSAVIARATRGWYSDVEVNRGLPPAARTRYLRPEGRGHQVIEHLRARTRFSEQNLIEPWPTRPPLDVIFMRNVLIYFDLPVKQTLLRRAYQALRPGGYLVLGAGETTLGVDVPLDVVPSCEAVLYRRTA